MFFSSIIFASILDWFLIPFGMARTTFRIILFAYFTLSALHEKVLKIIDLGFNSGIILAPFGINFQYFFDIDFSINLLMPFFKLWIEHVSIWVPFRIFHGKWSPKGSPRGLPKFPFFYVFSNLQPEGASGPSRTPLPDVFGDHFLMILAQFLRFLINKSITLEIILWSFRHSFLD